VIFNRKENLPLEMPPLKSEVSFFGFLLQVSINCKQNEACAQKRICAGWKCKVEEMKLTSMLSDMAQVTIYQS